MAIWHLVARVARTDVDLTDWGLAARVWRSLRRAFPEALAVGLMPDHLHVIDESLAADEARRAMGRALSRATYGMGKGVWQAVPKPDRVRESKLERAMRYVALNPCRAELAPDPLAWLWSTHRDVMGAVADPWIDGGRIATRLGPRRWHSKEAWHRYVSSDFAVSAGGTPPPEGMRAADEPTHTLGDIAAAVATALRVAPGAVKRKGPARRLFLALAYRQGWRDTALLARVLDISKRSVRRLLRPCSGDADLEAAALCLGDLRLCPRRPSRLQRPDSGHWGQDGRPSPG